MLDLRNLLTFRVVASTHNFTRAAAQLGCCQSTVTTHIQALERELGVVLFERYRLSKTVVLTGEGQLALKYAGRLLGLANEMKSAAKPCPVAAGADSVHCALSNKTPSDWRSAGL